MEPDKQWVTQTGNELFVGCIRMAVKPGEAGSSLSLLSEETLDLLGQIRADG